MNYYEHHIGDYAEATGHLSILEDGVYSRLIRKYYARERPLPANLKETQRLVGAKSKAERAAVEKVLREFFELREDGWHNERCDEEIVRYLDAEPEREARRTNEALRLKRHREERSQLFNELHAAGHAPPWNLRMAQLRALHALHCGSPATAPATPETRCSSVSAVSPATAPATPATATQTPVPSPQSEDPSQPFPSEPGRAARAKRAEGTNPRKLGTNPRATGTNSRQIRNLSLEGWRRACAAIDRVNGATGLTWAHADAEIADAVVTRAIQATGGHRLIADRSRFNASELEGRFRQAYEHTMREAAETDAPRQTVARGSA